MKNTFYQLRYIQVFSVPLHSIAFHHKSTLQEISRTTHKRVSQYLQFKNSFCVGMLSPIAFAAVGDNSVYLFPGPTVSSLHYRMVSLFFIGSRHWALFLWYMLCKCPLTGWLNAWVLLSIFPHFVITVCFCRVECSVSGILSLEMWLISGGIFAGYRARNELVWPAWK